MASIRKRKNGIYQLIVEAGRDANGKRIQKIRNVRVPNMREAKRELAKFVAEIEAGTYIAPQKMTFEKFVKDEWYPKHAEKNLALTTRKKYLVHLSAHILPVFGHMQLGNIKTLHLVTFFNDLQEDGARKDGKPGGLSATTRMDIYKILKSIFGKAAEWKAIRTDPMDGVSSPKLQKRTARFYEEEEVNKVIQALYDEPIQWRLYFLGAMMGGFRRGELTALEWSDVDWERNAITIRKSLSYTDNGEAIIKGTKTGRDRTVVMPAWYMRELRKFYLEWKKERIQLGEGWQGGSHQYLFHNGFGKPYHYATPSHRWTKFLQKHNLRPIHLHDLRHTAATLLIEEGVDLKSVQERLGHSTYRVTADIYAHVSKKLEKNTADKLEKFDPQKYVTRL